jgi:zinc and cadmium transporter
LVGDGLHNIADDILLAAAFVQLGMLTTFAVVAHNIPREMGGCGVLLGSEFFNRQAL